MGFEEVKEFKTYLKIKGFGGFPAVEVELETLASLIQFIAEAISSGQIELEKREVSVKRWTVELPKLTGEEGGKR
jgi:hypothetical protein